MGRAYKLARFYVVHDEVLFFAQLVTLDLYWEEMQDLIDYLFESFRITNMD